MTIGNVNLTGTVEVLDFEASFGTITLSTNKSQMLIPYTGYAYPELASVSLVVYEYSDDNGTTWDTMTPSDDTVLTGMEFKEDGEDLEFKWEVKTDLGTTFYNKLIRIRLQAQSGVTTSDLTATSVTFTRSVNNISTHNSVSPFPSDFSGVDGSELMRLAPKG